MDRIFTAFANRISAWAGQPASFVLATLVILVWAVSGPIFGWSDTWQLVINTGTTIVTFLMVFVIQNAQNRDAAAMQAKLDELIRALEGARGEFIGIEHLPDSKISEIRKALERENGCPDSDDRENGGGENADKENGRTRKQATLEASVETLLRRR